MTSVKVELIVMSFVILKKRKEIIAKMTNRLLINVLQMEALVMVNFVPEVGMKTINVKEVTIKMNVQTREVVREATKQVRARIVMSVILNILTNATLELLIIQLLRNDFPIYIVYMLKFKKEVK